MVFSLILVLVQPLLSRSPVAPQHCGLCGVEVLRPHEISFPLNTDFEVVGALHQHLCPELARSKVVRPQPSPRGTVAKQCVEPPAVIGVRCSGRDDAVGVQSVPFPQRIPFGEPWLSGAFPEIQGNCPGSHGNPSKTQGPGWTIWKAKAGFFRSAPGSL